MRQLKLKLLFVSMLGISLAYANKPHNFNTLHKYAFKNMTASGTKYYYTLDLTLYNYTKGIDYDCLFSYNICTFLGDPFKSHTDPGGTFFYVSDIPQSGIDWTGLFELSDF